MLGVVADARYSQQQFAAAEAAYGELLKLLPAGDAQQPAVAERLKPAVPISKSVQHLVANFRDEIRLEDLLKISGLSRPTFARQFKQHSGHSFSAFVNELRLQAARRSPQPDDRKRPAQIDPGSCRFPRIRGLVTARACLPRRAGKFSCLLHAAILSQIPFGLPSISGGHAGVIMAAVEVVFPEAGVGEITSRRSAALTRSISSFPLYPESTRAANLPP